MMDESSKATVPLTLQSPASALDHGQSDEDLARADLYGLLSELFGAAPSDAFFNRLAASPSSTDDEPDTPLTGAWRALVVKAAERAPHEIRKEFDALFVAVGKPEVVANASFYLAGALHQQPLVDIRAELTSLGIERDPASTETEDHFAALCEVMRFLVAGELDDEGPPRNLLLVQRSFFQGHLSSWAFDFFDAVERHPTADFYRATADFARAFFDVERQAFDIYVATQDPGEG
jgi:TorA maturation chaperone TorD